MLDQAHKLRELASVERRKQLNGEVRKSRRIAVTSGKGGVGKSNFALSLAIITAALNKKTLLIDADTNLANIDILMGVSPKYNLSHVLAGQKTTKEIVVEGPSGISILPAASGSIGQSLDDGIASDSIIHDLNSLETEYDVVVFDTGAGVSRAVLDFVLLADTVVLITTPEPTSITDAYAMVKLLTAERIDIDVQILINFASNKHEALEIYDRLSAVIGHFLNVEVSYLGFLPRDHQLEKAVLMQEPLVSAFPKSPASVQIKFIARKLLLPGDTIMEKPQGFLGSLFRKSAK